MWLCPTCCAQCTGGPYCELRYSPGSAQSCNCSTNAPQPWLSAVPFLNRFSLDQADNKFCTFCDVLLLPVQVCWHKFQVYFEIEPRYVPVTVDMPVMTAETARKYIDENTIGKVLPIICCLLCLH